ncbi:hypothetical protein BH10CYA1_BH10CYA1_13500 [soil metagenome]
MTDLVLFVALPYLAIFACVFGSIYRIRTQPMTYSALSSQFLESQGLMWGSLPWHIGILLILLGHLIAFLLPALWQSLMVHSLVLAIVESIGLGMSILCMLGLVVLAVRRITSAKIQAVTSTMDLVVLVLLLAQVGLGLATAAMYRWGALWCSATTTPYVWSIITFKPDISYVQDMPWIVKAHIICAWLFILVIPFSRLIHMFSVPLEYLIRPPQKVVWTNPRRQESGGQIFVKEESRRHFVRASMGIGLGLFLFSIGTVDKIFRFFFGPRLGQKEEAEIMGFRLKRLQLTAQQKQLELERAQTRYILVGSMGELSETLGKYFIDYQMSPAIAFKGEDGLPLMLSAKCTHLGCTVGNQVDAQGKVLCPCHISFFDIKTGAPNPDSPAKEPLPHIPWVVMDTKGKVLVSRSATGQTTGTVDPAQLASARVYIERQAEARS